MPINAVTLDQSNRSSLSHKKDEKFNRPGSGFKEGLANSSWPHELPKPDISRSKVQEEG